MKKTVSISINFNIFARILIILLFFVSIGCKDTSTKLFCNNEFIIETKNCDCTKLTDNRLKDHLLTAHWENAIYLTLTGINELKLLFYKVFSVYPLIVATFNQYFDKKTGLYFEKINSGVEYPNRDEAVDIVFGKNVYHIRIYHSESIGPHFSSPLFGVTRPNDGYWTSIISSPNLIHVLQWHSIKGYFFSLKSHDFSGFFIEDGVDNWNWGSSSGLIFINEGYQSTAWYWKYDRDSGEKRGSYQIKSADNHAKPFPPSFLKILSPLLAQVEKENEKEVEFWEGP